MDKMRSEMDDSWGPTPPDKATGIEEPWEYCQHWRREQPEDWEYCPFDPEDIWERGEFI